MSEQSQNNEGEGTKLRSCKLCGNELSPYSPFCRNCGHPQGSMLALWVMVAILILMIVMYIGMSIFCMCNVQDYRVYNGSQPGLHRQESAEPRTPESP